MDVTTIRSRNVALLVQRFGGPTEFGRRIEREQAQVSQWTSATNPKPIGGRLARYIESKLGHERGWLDAPQWEDAPASHSHPVRFDPRIIRGVARAVQDAATELHITLTVREIIELGVEMLERVTETGITTADVVWLVRRLGQGASRDAGRGGVPDGPRDAAGAMGRGKKA